MRKALFLLTLSFLFIIASIPAQGQTTDACADMTGHWSEAMGYDIGRPFVRYEPYNQRVIILEAGRRKTIQIVETGLAADHFYGELSPSCRYLAAAIALKNGMSQIVGLDLLTNTRASTIDSAPSAYRFSWSPVGEYAVAHTYEGAYLWNVPANQWLFLNPSGDNGDFYSYLTWDMARGQLLAVPGNAGNQVQAYDLRTGQIAATFDSGAQAAPVTYVLSGDRARIAVFTSEDERVHDRRASGLAVWDRDSGAKISLNPESLAAVWVSQVTFSPDNRYLVVARDTIRVWDLGNVRPDGLPTYQYDGPEGRIGTVRFADSNTLETLNVDVHPLSGYFWLRWNLVSGEFLHAYDDSRGHIVRDFTLE